jgi:uncharacterized protein (DUF2147 family)
MKLLALALLLLAAAPAPVTGRWVTAEGKAVVEIAPCGQALCGRIVRVLKPRPGGPAVDVNNPDARLRTRPIEGIQILSGFTADGAKWKGRIYDPESGRTYRSELAAAGGGLKVKGCFGPFCRTQDWTRAR